MTQVLQRFWIRNHAIDGPEYNIFKEAGMQLSARGKGFDLTVASKQVQGGSIAVLGKTAQIMLRGGRRIATLLYSDTIPPYWTVLPHGPQLRLVQGGKGSKPPQP